jgi:hypothetical protein
VDVLKPLVLGALMTRQIRGFSVYVHDVQSDVHAATPPGRSGVGDNLLGVGAGPVLGDDTAVVVDDCDRQRKMPGHRLAPMRAWYLQRHRRQGTRWFPWQRTDTDQGRLRRDTVFPYVV